MIVELKGSDYYYIPLVDLRLHDSPTNGTYVRSFDTSAQVIDWVKNYPGQVFRAVRPNKTGALVHKLPPSPASYSLATGDVIVGDLMVYDSYGLRVPGLARGSG
jgi:hypothetical protein